MIKTVRITFEILDDGTNKILRYDCHVPVDTLKEFAQSSGRQILTYEASNTAHKFWDYLVLMGAFDDKVK